MITIHFLVEGSPLSHFPEVHFDVAPPLAEKGDQIICPDGVVRTIASRRFVYGAATNVYLVLAHP